MITAGGAPGTRSRRCRCRRAGSCSCLPPISVRPPEALELHVTSAAHGPQGGLADLEAFAELLGRQPLLFARRAFEFGHHLPDGGFDLFEVVLRHSNGFWSVNQVSGFFSFASNSCSVHLGRM